MKYFVLFISLLFGVQTLIQSQNLNQQLQQIMAGIYPSDQPGAALLVMQNGNAIFREGFGLVDLNEKRKITPATNFRMASVSKQFTAMCILTLWKEGKLKPEDPITKYLTGLPEFAKEITIWNLLTHSSGLEDYENLIPKIRKMQVSDHDVLDLIRQSDSLYFKPGTQFRYSNTGFCMLANIVEKVSWMRYQDFIATKIFEPLKMSHSMMLQKNKEIPDRAFGYHNGNGQWKFADQSITSATMGDGCVYTSLNDYEKWMEGLWHQQLIKFDSAHSPLLPHIRINSMLDYGFGWFTTREEDGSRADFHSGESTGFHNMVYHNPSKKLLIVIFSNSDDDRISQAFDKVAEVMNVRLPFGGKEKSLFHVLSNIYE